MTQEERNNYERQRETLLQEIAELKQTVAFYAMASSLEYAGDGGTRARRMLDKTRTDLGGPYERTY